MSFVSRITDALTAIAADMAEALRRGGPADLAALRASTTVYPVGSIVRTRAEGFGYQVVATGGDLVTTGGVRLLVLPGPNGLDIRAFGAIAGNAATTPSIQAAISAGQTRGLAVYIPPGEFLLNPSTLAVTQSLTIYGAGPASKLRRAVNPPNRANAMIQITGAANVTLKDFWLDGGGGALSGNGRGVSVVTSNNVTLDGLTLTNCYDRGIYFVDGTDDAETSASRIADCSLRDINGHAIEIHNCSNVIVEGNRITRCTFSGIRVYATTVSRSRGINIVDNVIVNAVSGGISIPFVSGQTAQSSGVWDVTVAGNTVIGAQSNGIAVQAKAATVTGNVVSRNGTETFHQGILINSWDVSVTGNTVSDNAGVGIDFGDCKRVVCSGNIVLDNYLLGIEINSTEDFVVTGNMVRGNNKGNGAVPANKAAGILVHKGGGGYVFPGDSFNGVIANNVVRTAGGSFQQFGISVEAGSKNVRILGNDAEASGSVRDFNIQAASGEFITDVNNVARETFVAATSITIKQVGKFFVISPGSNLRNILTDGGTYEIGREIFLRFTGSVTVENGSGNIYLQGNTNFAAGNGHLLHLIRADAASWLEVSRRTA